MAQTCLWITEIKWLRILNLTLMAGSNNTPTCESPECLVFPFDVEVPVMLGLCLIFQILLAFLIDSFYLCRYHLTTCPFEAQVTTVSGGFQLLGNKTPQKLWGILCCRSQQGFHFPPSYTELEKYFITFAFLLAFVFGGTELAEMAYQNECPKNVCCHKKWFYLSRHCRFNGKANEMFSSLTNATV